MSRGTASRIVIRAIDNGNEVKVYEPGDRRTHTLTHAYKRCHSAFNFKHENLSDNDGSINLYKHYECWQYAILLIDASDDNLSIDYSMSFALSLSYMTLNMPLFLYIKSWISSLDKQYDFRIHISSINIVFFYCDDICKSYFRICTNNKCMLEFSYYIGTCFH